jgi:hypothetical protein
MLGELKVLHVNIGKRKTAHWSLFCDESLADFDSLAVVEPCIYEDLNTGGPAFPVERNWQLFKPSTKQEGDVRYAYRTAVWVSKRHAVRQVAVPTNDVVAVSIPTKCGVALIMSAYDVKSTDGQATNEEQLRSKLQTIRNAYHGAKSSGRGTQVDLLLSLHGASVPYIRTWTLVPRHDGPTLYEATVARSATDEARADTDWCIGFMQLTRDSFEESGALCLGHMPCCETRGQLGRLPTSPFLGCGLLIMIEYDPTSLTDDVTGATRYSNYLTRSLTVR